MAENLKDESHSIYHAFTKNKPTLNDENNIEILINNSIQESEINEKKTKILSFLKEKLSNRTLTLTTKIISNDQSQQKAYLPEEKFKILSDKNPNLKSLKDVLGLDFY